MNSNDYSNSKYSNMPASDQPTLGNIILVVTMIGTVMTVIGLYYDGNISKKISNAYIYIYV